MDDDQIAMNHHEVFDANSLTLIIFCDEFTMFVKTTDLVIVKMSGKSLAHSNNQTVMNVSHVVNLQIILFENTLQMIWENLKQNQWILQARVDLPRHKKQHVMHGCRIKLHRCRSKIDSRSC